MPWRICKREKKRAKKTIFIKKLGCLVAFRRLPLFSRPSENNKLLRVHSTICSDCFRDSVYSSFIKRSAKCQKKKKRREKVSVASILPPKYKNQTSETRFDLVREPPMPRRILVRPRFSPILNMSRMMRYERLPLRHISPFFPQYVRMLEKTPYVVGFFISVPALPPSTFRWQSQNAKRVSKSCLVLCARRKSIST